MSLAIQIFQQRVWTHSSTSPISSHNQPAPQATFAATRYGPHQRRVDLSAFKTIDITESLKFQLRAECFNISNTPNFLNPNSQISATANGVATNGGGFGSITQTNPGIAARQFQFAAKILF